MFKFDDVVSKVTVELLLENSNDAKKKQRLRYIQNQILMGMIGSEEFVKEFGDEIVGLKSKEIRELYSAFMYEQRLQNISNRDAPIDVRSFVNPELAKKYDSLKRISKSKKANLNSNIYKSVDDDAREMGDN